MAIYVTVRGEVPASLLPCSYFVATAQAGVSGGGRGGCNRKVHCGQATGGLKNGHRVFIRGRAVPKGLLIARIRGRKRAPPRAFFTVASIAGRVGPLLVASRRGRGFMSCCGARLMAWSQRPPTFSPAIRGGLSWAISLCSARVRL